MSARPAPVAMRLDVHRVTAMEPPAPDAYGGDAEDEIWSARQPRVIATRPSLPARLWRAVRIAWVRLLIWDMERYLEECHRHGIEGTLALWEFNSQLEDLRVRLALLEAGQ